MKSRTVAGFCFIFSSVKVILAIYLVIVTLLHEGLNLKVFDDTCLSCFYFLLWKFVSSSLRAEEVSSAAGQSEVHLSGRLSWYGPCQDELSTVQWGTALASVTNTWTPIVTVLKAVCWRPARVFSRLQRLYKAGKDDDMHKYTLHSDDPDFVRAKINAQQISDVSRSRDASHNPKYRQK